MFDSFGENTPEEKWTNDNRQLKDIGSFASVKEWKIKEKWEQE